ncbi:flagella synthesis protein FlgN [Enterovibrio paralichthyis]|uniref:flagella synthesis protein FlgN n=1 Tax=Enterovibrio paralichthyis TaxID=2853805 RepID=UPI001C48B067|nr:flagellar export chaperone FlgN [Enterovibrio paralichthyis]MBV7298517.1 flagellar export chaperone FlgN [Enterovibrio paralichthyis]
MTDQPLSFDALLQQQADEIAALFSLLESETDAIASRKASAIEACAKQKLNLIQAIQLRDAKLARCPEIQAPSDDTKAAIQAIKTELEKCQQLNEANGVVLQRAHLSMHKLRNLFQEATGKSEMTYDSEGQASGSRTLGTNVKA